MIIIRSKVQISALVCMRGLPTMLNSTRLYSRYADNPYITPHCVVFSVVKLSINLAQKYTNYIQNRFAQVIYILCYSVQLHELIVCLVSW